MKDHQEYYHVIDDDGDEWFEDNSGNQVGIRELPWKNFKTTRVRQGLSRSKSA